MKFTKNYDHLTIFLSQFQFPKYSLCSYNHPHKETTQKRFNKRLVEMIRSGETVIKLFTVVIYCHSMVKPLFCDIKYKYCSKYHRMAVNNPNKKFYNIGPRWQK